MRTKNQPTVLINYNIINPNGCYNPDTNEIIVDDGSNMNAILYHEYRHYLQCTKISIFKYIHALSYLYKRYEMFFIICLVCMPKNLTVGIVLAISMLLLSIPILIEEFDANIFSYKRLVKKGLTNQAWVLLQGQTSYLINLWFIPLHYLLSN